MSSRIGQSYRRERAARRESEAFARIAAALGLTFDEPPARRRDADEEATAYRELVADRLGAIAAAVETRQADATTATESAAGDLRFTSINAEPVTFGAADEPASEPAQSTRRRGRP